MAKPRLLGMAATVLAAGIALSGCAGQPGAAAIVDGEAITEQALSRSGQELQPFLQDQLPPRSILSSMIQADVFLRVASEYGLAASPEEAGDYLDQIADQAGIDPPEDYPEGTLEVARMLMVTQELQTSDQAEEIQQDIRDGLDDLEVTINPRYGNWDPQTAGAGLIDSPTPEWLIIPDDSAGMGGLGAGGSDAGESGSGTGSGGGSGEAGNAPDGSAG